MTTPRLVRGAITTALCADPATIADWCTMRLGLIERQRWHDRAGSVTNVELVAGDGEVWLERATASTPHHAGDELTAWVGIVVDDVVGLGQRLEAAGERAVVRADRKFGVRMVEVVDPEGRYWGLLQRVDPPLEAEDGSRC